MALILVLWIMLALILLAAGISIMARTETQISRNHSDLIRCRWAARAGIYSAMEKLKTLNEEQNTYLGEEPYTVTADDLSLDFGGYVFNVVIQDETSRVNINAAEAPTLTKLFEITDLVDCIIDWRDADETPGSDGAETEYYNTLKPSYNCKNTDFETVRELQLVKGVTSDILSAPMTTGTTPLIDMLTVFAPKTAAAADTSGLVDIQSASQESLQNAFGSVLTADDITAIIQYRTSQAFKTPAEIVLVPGLDRSKIEQIYDRLTISGFEAKKGLVNINTASVDVLSVIPGFDQDIATAIINYRKDQGAYSSVSQLLETKEVTNEAFVSAAPYFTIKSIVFRIISTGSLESSGATATITCIVEISSDGKTQIRYWQE
jgi:general secretion pathway protein K